MEILKNLLKVKSIVTIAIIFTLCWKTFDGTVPIELFIPLAASIITYFFTKKDKKED